jgi:uncharacterized membrane protein YhaH (DUF805 family)
MSALIHILRNREKEGPYTTQQIQHMLTDGSIARYTLARKEGLSEWAPISQILESLQSESSYTGPLPASIATSTTTGRDGIGRLAYFVIFSGFMIYSSLLQAAVASDESASGLVALLSLAICFFPVVLRLQNIGKSPWWSLLILIPLANVYIGILCLLAPAGYEQSKKLDAPANVILLIAIVFIVLIALNIIFFVLF